MRGRSLHGLTRRSNSAVGSPVFRTLQDTHSVQDVTVAAAIALLLLVAILVRLRQHDVVVLVVLQAGAFT